jgi:DNA-binding MarR family transcriptional regulator
MVNSNFPTVKKTRSENALGIPGPLEPHLGIWRRLTEPERRDSLAPLIIMTRVQAREAARELLKIMPLVMRTVAAELRSAGEMPAPAHFPLLMMLNERPRSLTELADLRGVSLPTMSNSITSVAQRGWVRRITPGRDGRDRRVVLVEITAAGRAALERVGHSAEGHLADILAPLDAASHRRLEAGLGVLRKVFAAPPDSAARRRRSPRVVASDTRRQRVEHSA